MEDSKESSIFAYIDVMDKLRCLCLIISCLICTSGYSQKITIAVSSNAQYVLKELVHEFKKNKKVEIDIIVGSSGKLTNQILLGAPFNIFFSADLEYPSHLFEKGLTATKPKVYGYGSLVLWTTKNLTIKGDLKFLKESNIERIGLADPENSPYGKQAVIALRKAGIYDSIKHKIVEGESISQVNQYISSGNIDIGFTARSIVSSDELKKIGKWIEVDSVYYDPIPQAVVVLKNDSSEINTMSKSFLNFVLSPVGNQILKKNGYKIK